MNKKFLKQTLCLVLVLFMIISTISPNLAEAAPGDSRNEPIMYNQSDTVNFPQYPNDGSVAISKTVEWVDGKDNIAQVTMKLEGVGMPKKSDIVLVIDRSGSMKDSINIYTYREVPVTFIATEGIGYQYKSGILSSWRDATTYDASVTMTALVDNNGSFVGYKKDDVSVSGFNSGDKRLNKNSSSFSSWTSTAGKSFLISVFSGKTAHARVDNTLKSFVFPTNAANIASTSNPLLRSSTKIAEARTAAKQFVAALLANDNLKELNRISIVSYSSSGYGKGTVYEEHALSNNNNSLNTAITNISADGGTHIQAGIAKAQDILRGSAADNRYIVLLSDGEPTYSYKATAARVAEDEDREYNYPDESKLNFVLTEFSSTTLGTGSNYKYNSNQNYYAGGHYEQVWIEGHYEWIIIIPIWVEGHWEEQWINEYQVANNGIPTISQALLAKEDGIELYSVGFDVSNNEDAKFTMEYVASSKDNFYLTTDDLTGVFTDIAGRIAKAGTEAIIGGEIKVNDTAGYNFTIITGNNEEFPISASYGRANILANSISWNLGDITETEAELTYYIKLNVTGGTTIPDDAMLETGGDISVIYKNHNDKWVQQDFAPSQLSAGAGTVNVSYYIADGDGKPVNSDGVEIPFANRISLQGSNYSESAVLGTMLTVASYAKPFNGYANQSSIARDNDGNVVPAQIPVSRKTIYLNFPYVPVPKYKVTYIGNENTAGDVPVDNNEYAESETVTIKDKGTLEKTGFTFAGWASNDVTITNNTFTMPKKNVVLTAQWQRSEYTLTIKYVNESGIPLRTADTHKINAGSHYEFGVPELVGLKPNRENVTGTMPSHNHEEVVYYSPIVSTLNNNSMYRYSSNKPVSVGNSSNRYDIIKDFDYTFGFDFTFGNKDLVITVKADNGAELSNFKLYDKDNNEVKDYSKYLSISGDSSIKTIEFKDKADIVENEDYTIVYNLKQKYNQDFTITIDGNIRNGKNMLTTAGTVSKTLMIQVGSPLDLE